MSIVVAPDGKHAVVGGVTGSLAVLDLGDLAAINSDPDALCSWAELLEESPELVLETVGV